MAPGLRAAGGDAVPVWWEGREVVAEVRVCGPFSEVCVLTWKASALLESPGQTW